MRFLKTLYAGGECRYHVLDFANVMLYILKENVIVIVETCKVILSIFWISFSGFDKKDIGKRYDDRGNWFGNEEVWQSVLEKTCWLYFCLRAGWCG